MNEKNVKNIIESLLFIWGEPLNIDSISNVLDLPREFIRKCIIDLKDEFYSSQRGIQLIEINDSFQLCSNSDYFEYIQKLCSPPQYKGFTQAALEVLSIIAYKQPITRHEIERIRGVKSDKAISTLLEKGMIVENGRLEKTGRPIIYITTDYFLRAFGLSNLDELPDKNQLNNMDLVAITEEELKD